MRNFSIENYSGYIPLPKEIRKIESGKPLKFRFLYDSVILFISGDFSVTSHQNKLEFIPEKIKDIVKGNVKGEFTMRITNHFKSPKGLFIEANETVEISSEDCEVWIYKWEDMENANN